MIGSQPFLQRICIVVGPLDKWFARHIILHRFLRRIEDLVIATAGGGMDEPASNAGNEEAIVDLKFDSVFQRLLLLSKHLIKALSLGYGTGEAVKYEAEVLSVFQARKFARECLTHLHILGW